MSEYIDTTEKRPDIFEYLSSLNDPRLMENFYKDPSC